MKKEFKLKFRKAKDFDFDFFRKLMVDYINQTKKRDNVEPKELLNDWKDVKDKLYIVINKNKKIGTFLLEDDKKSYLYISRLHVIPELRGNGIGSYLLKYFENNTKKRKLRLHVWPNNPSVRLYKRFGYKVIGKTKKGKFLMEKIK